MTNSIHTNEMLALKDWLKAMRQERALSMRALAERLNKPHSYIQKVEDGERRLDIVEYVWYCRALDINPQEGVAIIEKSIPTDH